MNSKIILHGGFRKGEIQENDKFFREMLKDTPHELNLLLVYFAEKVEKISDRIEQDKSQFNKNSSDKIINYKVATVGTFLNDVGWADVVYLHGGKTAKIMETLNNYSGLRELFSSKIIAGDSAGANALCAYYFSKNSQKIGQGLGILPIKLVPHFEKGKEDPFIDFETGLETVLLSEYEMRIFES
jgi:peptidase E